MIKIKCYDKNDKDVMVEVVEVIDSRKFRIKDSRKFRIKALEREELDTPYIDNKIFVLGTELDDFHTLSKEYIFTLNVCATQELHRRIESQEERIKELETKLEKLINYMKL